MPTVVLCLIGFIFLIFVYITTRRQVIKFCRDGLSPKEQFELENSARDTVARAFGGLVVLLGVWATWGTLLDSKEAHITDRFTAAIEQIGASYDGKAGSLPNREVRCGGIYELGQIALDSQEDREPTLRALSDYLRLNDLYTFGSSVSERTADVGAALQVLPSILAQPNRVYKLDLSGIDLRNTDLTSIHLEAAVLKLAHLEGASLLGANLSNANLENAVLREAILDGADLTGAQLSGADLRGVNLDKLKLTQIQRESAITGPL